MAFENNLLLVSGCYFTRFLGADIEIDMISVMGSKLIRLLRGGSKLTFLCGRSRLVCSGRSSFGFNILIEIILVFVSRHQN